MSGRGLDSLVRAYFEAKDKLRAFENKHPDDLSSRWEKLLDEVEAAESDLRKAVALEAYRVDVG